MIPRMITDGVSGISDAHKDGHSPWTLMVDNVYFLLSSLRQNANEIPSYSGMEMLFDSHSPSFPLAGERRAVDIQDRGPYRQGATISMTSQ